MIRYESKCVVLDGDGDALAFRRRLIALREGLGLSQQELADKLGSVSDSDSWYPENIQGWENMGDNSNSDHESIWYSTLAHFVNALETTESFLVSGYHTTRRREAVLATRAKYR